jgi:hypothetical protein
MVQPVSPELTAVLVPSQLKLCPYDEEEPAFWFRLIEAHFPPAGNKSKKIKYANILANLQNRSSGTF